MSHYDPILYIVDVGRGQNITENQESEMGKSGTLGLNPLYALTIQLKCQK